MHRFYRLAAITSWAVFATALSGQDDSAAGLRQQALDALSQGNNREAIEHADAMMRLAPDNARATLAAADIYLRAAKFALAARLFDRYLETNKEDLPALWQRGIALYFSGEYREAARQFEEHRTVNPNDVENAAWHFLCVAKAESPAEAKKQLLPAPGDPRPPMEEVLEMLKTGNRKLVIDKVESFPADSKQRQYAQFYGDFYLGLYADALGQAEAAKKYMSRSAKDAPRNYMGDVARVYAKYLSERKSR